MLPAVSYHNSFFALAGSAAARRRKAKATLGLLRELLQKDYAVGYLLLGWIFRCTWALAPAVAVMLGLPQPDKTSKQQLPGLLAWMIQVSQRLGLLQQRFHCMPCATASLKPLSVKCCKGKQSECVTYISLVYISSHQYMPSTLVQATHFLYADGVALSFLLLL
jgi:hypothetical protein